MHCPYSVIWTNDWYCFVMHALDRYLVQMVAGFWTNYWPRILLQCMHVLHCLISGANGGSALNKWLTHPVIAWVCRSSCGRLWVNLPYSSDKALLEILLHCIPMYFFPQCILLMTSNVGFGSICLLHPTHQALLHILLHKFVLEVKCSDTKS